VPTGAISPALANLLALRARLGGGALAKLLARLADPFGGNALQLLPAVNAEESEVLLELLCDSGSTALIFESADADAVIDAERRPAMTLVSEGRVKLLFEAEAGSQGHRALDQWRTRRPHTDAGTDRQPDCLLSLWLRLCAGSESGEGNRCRRDRQPRSGLSPRLQAGAAPAW
jgi:anthranilate phosphoribosyltransferase